MVVLKSVLLLMTCTLSSPPHPTLWSYLCSSLSCSWPVRYHPHPTPPHPLVLCMLKSVLLLTCTLSSPPHPTPPHPCRYNWAQILDFVGTSETNTCRYKWVKSVGASEPLPSGSALSLSLSILYTNWTPTLPTQRVGWVKTNELVGYCISVLFIPFYSSKFADNVYLHLIIVYQ